MSMNTIFFCESLPFISPYFSLIYGLPRHTEFNINPISNLQSIKKTMELQYDDITRS